MLCPVGGEFDEWRGREDERRSCQRREITRERSDGFEECAPWSSILRRYPSAFFFAGRHLVAIVQRISGIGELPSATINSNRSKSLRNWDSKLTADIQCFCLVYSLLEEMRRNSWNYDGFVEGMLANKIIGPPQQQGTFLPHDVANVIKDTTDTAPDHTLN